MVAYPRNTRTFRKFKDFYFLAINKGTTVITGPAIIIIAACISPVLTTKNTRHSIIGTININCLSNSNYSVCWH